MSLTLLTSKTTWVIITMFITGGLAAIGAISPSVSVTLLTLLGGSGLVAHNSQIQAGKVR